METETRMNVREANRVVGERIAKHLSELLREAVGKPCIICGASGTKGCLWVIDPRIAEQHKGSIKKQRVYVYTVCDEHDPQKLVLPESKERFQAIVNKEIIRKLTLAANG